MATNDDQSCPSCPACGVALAAGDAARVCPKCATVLGPAPSSAADGHGPTVLVDVPSATAESVSLCGKCGARLNRQGVMGYCPKCLFDGLDETTGDGVSGAAQPEIPGYRFLRTLGRGGMGTVWLAEQLATKQPVAIKLCTLENFGAGDGAARLRFQREVELAARLNHPNIARVLGGGDLDGAAYYVMEFVEGGTLGAFVQEKRPAVREIIGMMRTVCEAVQHAHQNAIIHRDLKPSNIMVTADGAPKVVDFGLAKALEGGAALQDISMAGQIIGTPRYMAPEQVGGDVADTRTDVYALGVILFELLTGEHPHDVSGTWEVLLRRIATEEPRRPRSIRPELGGELEMLLLKALGRKPDDRYRTAGELADELGRWLRSEPLSVGSATPWYFARKWIARHRAATAAAAAVMLLAAGATVFYVVNIRAERDKVVRGEKQTRRLLAESLAHNGELAAQRGRWREALEQWDAAITAGHPGPEEIRLRRVEALEALERRQEFASELAALAAMPLNPQQRARVDVWRAEREFSHGQTDAAVAILRAIPNGLLPPPDAAYVQSRLAGSVNEAVAELERAVERSSHHHQANLALCMALVMGGRRDEVLLRAAAGGALYPDDPSFPAMAAIIHALSGRRAEMEKIVNGRLANAPRVFRELPFIISDLAAFMSEKILLTNNDDRKGAPGTLDVAKDVMQMMPMVVRIRSLGGGQGEESLGFRSAFFTPLARRILVDAGEASLKGVFLKDPKAGLAALQRLEGVWDVGEVAMMKAGMLVQLGDSKGAREALAEALKRPMMVMPPEMRHRLLQWQVNLQPEFPKGDTAALKRMMDAYRDLAKSGPVSATVARNGVVPAVEGGELGFARWLAYYIPRDKPESVFLDALLERAAKNYGAAWSHLRKLPGTESKPLTNSVLHQVTWLGAETRKLQRSVIDDAWKRLADFEKAAGTSATVRPEDREFIREVVHYRLIMGELGLESESRAMLERCHAALEKWQAVESEKVRPDAPGRRCAEEFADAWLTGGERAEAERVLFRFLETRSRSHPNDVRIPHVEARLGEMLVRQRLFAEAEPLLLRAVPALEKERTLSPRALADLCRQIVRICARTGRETDAAKWRAKVVAVLAGDKDIETKTAPLQAKLADARRKPGGQAHEPELWQLFWLYLNEHRFEAAEPLGREALAMREKSSPDKWWTFKSKAALGTCLLSQERHAEAEPLLAAGCEGMLQRFSEIPAKDTSFVKESIEALIRLHDDAAAADKATEWRGKLWNIPVPKKTE